MTHADPEIAAILDAEHVEISLLLLLLDRLRNFGSTD